MTNFIMDFIAPDGTAMKLSVPFESFEACYKYGEIFYTLVVFYGSPILNVGCYPGA